MLVNAVKYGLWKASRLEPRKGFADDNTATATATGWSAARGSLRKAAMKSTCLLG
jgi:hypothetical protein